MIHPRNFASVVTALAVGTLSFTVIESAAAFTVYADRASFQTQLRHTIVDDYEAPGYLSGNVSDSLAIDIFTDDAMSAVLGETRYTTTGTLNRNIVVSGIVGESPNRQYCAGCNGSFLLDFTHTSIGSSQGVFGAGFDVTSLTNYVAHATFGDGTTENFNLSGLRFFGLTARKAIKTLHVGRRNGGSTNDAHGYIEIDNLTIGSNRNIPTPAPLSGLVVTGIAALRKRKRKAAK
ncbi:MAG: hypothetical protein Kow00121_00870 [Elainellaceae cyanobacterium]